MARKLFRLGKYCQISPFIFSFEPRSQKLYGLAKYVFASRLVAKCSCSANSFAVVGGDGSRGMVAVTLQSFGDRFASHGGRLVLDDTQRRLSGATIGHGNKVPARPGAFHRIALPVPAHRH